jgi:hypothetical protein
MLRGGGGRASTMLREDRLPTNDDDPDRFGSTSGAARLEGAENIAIF